MQLAQAATAIVILMIVTAIMVSVLQAFGSQIPTAQAGITAIILLIAIIVVVVSLLWAIGSLASVSGRGR